MTKRNLNKVPAAMLERIRNFDQDDIVVACVKSVRSESIDKYSHLGLKMVGTELVVPQPALPVPTAGRYSTANVQGLEKVRKDLPKVGKSFDTEMPNWGDWSNGSHTVTRTRSVYQREFFPPKEVALSIALVERKNGVFIVRFAIDQVINRRTPNYEFELLYNLNILQENLGASDVFPSAMSLAEFAATVRVDWQIFPGGSLEEAVQAIVKGRRFSHPDQEKTMRQRMAIMAKLSPAQYIVGTDGFARYFGAKFGENFVVFENIRYGNALYLMYDSWQELSQLSRMELLAGPRDSFDRIEHKDGWDAILRKRVLDFRKGRGKS